MSLIVHTIVRDGIVACSDTRTTCKDLNNGGIKYIDTEEKIIPFPNNIIVSHCGDGFLNKNSIKSSSITAFLYKIRKTIGEKATINDLPLLILTEYIKEKGNSDTIFLISGFDSENACYTYKIKTLTKEISLMYSPYSYGSIYYGKTEIAHSIMSSIKEYSSLSIDNAIDLTQTCVKSNIKVSKYQPIQSIGGECKTYIIDKLHNKIGWLTDNNCELDQNALPNALELYEEKKEKK